MNDNSRKENKKNEECELLSTCPFFNQFQGHQEVIKQGWIRSYCQSKEKSMSCARKKERIETGRAPAANMTPTGKILTTDISSKVPKV